MKENKQNIIIVKRKEKLNNSIIIKEKNVLGIEILRIILCFTVVLDHLYINTNFDKFHFIIYYHIPCFFIISFYFNYKTFISFNIKKIKGRLERLFIPYFCWSIISWIINVIYFEIFNIEGFHSFKYLLIHLINGHQFNYSLWFQNIISLITILFLIIIFIFRKNFISILLILNLVAYISQYTGFNYNFFINNFTINSSATFGRFAEAIPNAVAGFFLAYIDLLKKSNKYKYIYFYMSIIVLLFITKYHEFDNIKTFKYGGIRLNIAAISLFIIFSLLPFEKIKNRICIKIIKQITSYTGGIYFMHRLFGYGHLCRKYIPPIEKGNFLGCIIIYLICYIISFIMSIFLKNTKLRHLFS
jgi:fucose 4-O-acetylase-like acetyltransferase